MIRYHVYVDGSYRGWILDIDDRFAWAQAWNKKGCGADIVLVRRSGTKKMINFKF